MLSKIWPVRDLNSRPPAQEARALTFGHRSVFKFTENLIIFYIILYVYHLLYFVSLGPYFIKQTWAEVEIERNLPVNCKSVLLSLQLKLTKLKLGVLSLTFSAKNKDMNTDKLVIY